MLSMEHDLNLLDPLQMSIVDLSGFGAPEPYQNLFFPPRLEPTMNRSEHEPKNFLPGPSTLGNESGSRSGFSGKVGPVSPTNTSSPAQDPSTDSTSPSTRPESECTTPDDKHTTSNTSEEWPFFRCNPPSRRTIDPKIGRAYLEGLRRDSRTLDGQSTNLVSKNAFDQSGPTFARPFDEGLRDRLMGITQCFLVKGWETHGSGNLRDLKAMDSRVSGIVSLPSLATLHRFLETYCYRYEPFYSIFPSSQFSPSSLDVEDERVVSLMLLLMIAQGALESPILDARVFASGITEACRIGMQDLMEKDVSLSVQPDMLRCLLLFINLGSWCGARWHMDIATGQYTMFLSMLKQSSILQNQDLQLPEVDDALGVETAWTLWKQHESKKRLAYAWIIIDQELSLFQDTPSRLSLTDIHVEIPEDDILWKCKTAEEWIHLVMNKYKNAQSSEGASSLPVLFRRFMSEGASMNVPKRGLSPLELRLLLQPLQRLMCNLHECFTCFSDAGNNRQAQRLVNQLEDSQALLQQWYTLASRAPQRPSHFCVATISNLITYHLISLNAMTCFQEVEALARAEIKHDAFCASFWARRFVDDKAQILVHCGQVEYLARMIPRQCRPPWWPAAIYRVALTMWATCIANASTSTSSSISPEETSLQQHFLIDQLMLEHSSIVRYVRFGEGVPMLSRTTGGMVSLTPDNVLQQCMEVLEEGSDWKAVAMVDGIHSRLAKLAERTRGP